MFRFFKYIILFILGYKVLKQLFAEYNTQDTVPQTPPKQNINSTNYSQNQQHSQHSKFNNAEPIDYEEVK
ncbi:MAG: hypothetical protein U0T69_09920 [Chitinophagales bacterium]